MLTPVQKYDGIVQAMCCDAQQNAGSVQQCVGSGPVENMMALCSDTFVLPEPSKTIVLRIWGNFASSIIRELNVLLHMQTVSKALASFQNNLTETIFL